MNIAITIAIDSRAMNSAAIRPVRQYSEESRAAAATKAIELRHALECLTVTHTQRIITEKILAHASAPELQAVLIEKRFLPREAVNAFVAKHNITL